MTHESIVHSTAQPRPVAVHAEDFPTSSVNRISWGGVFAGIAVALVTQLLLNLLGVGIGVATLDPGTSDNPAISTFSISAGVWYVVAAIIAIFIGSFVASRLSGRTSSAMGGLHGVTTWAVTTLVLVYLLTTAVGGLVGGVFGTLGNAIGGLGNAAGHAAQSAAPALSKVSNPFDAIEQQIRDASGGNDPQTLRRTAVTAVKAAVTGDAEQQNAANEQAAQALAKAQNVPVDQARRQVQTYEQQYKQAVATAKQKATEAADATVKAVSRGAFFAVIALVLGAIAAWFGGQAGTVRREKP